VYIQKNLLDEIIEKLVLDKPQIVLDQFNKESSLKVTKPFIAKYIKDWESNKGSGKTSKSMQDNDSKKSPKKKETGTKNAAMENEEEDQGSDEE